MTGFRCARSRLQSIGKAHQDDRGAKSLADRRPVVPVHDVELQRQAHRRTRRGSDDEGVGPDPAAVRTGRIKLLLPVFDFGGDRRICRQPRADAVAAAGDGGGFGGDPAADDRFDRFNNGDCLPCHAWRGGRTGLPRRPAFAIQMVSRSTAGAADCPGRTRRGNRPGADAAGAQLAGRAVLLALGLRRTRHRRARLAGRLAALRGRGQA